MAKDTGFYLKGLCCVYDKTVNGIDLKFVISTVLQGWKYQLPDMVGFGGLENLFGSRLSGGAAQARQPQAGAFNDMPANSVIEWQSEGT